jgi:hypothetical protein
MVLLGKWQQDAMMKGYGHKAEPHFARKDEGTELEKAGFTHVFIGLNIRDDAGNYGRARAGAERKTACNH